MSWRLVVASILVHLVLIFSIFDVYYTSPLVTGIAPHLLTNIEPPAKRIVIFSADGLRYDTFNEHTEQSPYLHSIIRDRKGVSGLSLSHVPTESRPGHVAIFAGITEDMSAVAKGWKKNPVKFDSVFNRSSSSYMWGSPDIVELFDDIPHAKSFSYSAEEEDFAAADASNLDRWVFDQFENFIKNASEYERNELSGGQKVFFLHLLGIDTNGHGHKPHSKQYIENIRVVDDGIARVQKLADEFFGDDRTAYLFTSDHGMTDWGSHGAGTNEEVLTPFIAWGAGLRKGGARYSLNQIDLAPLISTLIGAAIPVNSMGVLPVQIMQTGNMKYEFRAILANFMQLKEQVLHLRNAKSHRFWFRQFDEFGDKAMGALETEMVRLARARRFEAAISLFSDKAHLMKKAIVFYHRYDRQMLGAAVSATFVAWIALVIAFLTGEGSSKLNPRVLRPNPLFGVLLIATLAFAVYCPLTITQTVYVLLPVFLLSVVENYANVSTEVRNFIGELTNKKQLAQISVDRFVRPFFAFIVFVIIIGAFVLTFVDRRFLALIFVFLAFLPAAYSSPLVEYWTTTWRTICILLLPFPFLPSVGVSQHIIICILSPAALAFACRRLSTRPCLARLSGVLKMLTLCHAATAVFIMVVHYGFVKPPSIARWMSWLTLPLAFVLPPILTRPFIVDRLIMFAMLFYIPYSLLSISYESLFMLLFLPLLAMFVRFEFSHLSDVELLQLKVTDVASDGTMTSRATWVDVRRAVVCVSLVLSTLFGTGNFASINSFNPSTLNLFISVFSPFTMAILLILKLLLPILCVSLCVACIVRFDKILIRRLCCIVLIITDFMSMCFFHQLRDEGSWLDIGMSISQYIVSICISLALLLLLALSSSLISLGASRTTSAHKSKEIESPTKSRLSDAEESSA